MPLVFVKHNKKLWATLNQTHTYTRINSNRLNISLYNFVQQQIHHGKSRIIQWINNNNKYHRDASHRASDENQYRFSSFMQSTQCIYMQDIIMDIALKWRKWVESNNAICMFESHVSMRTPRSWMEIWENSMRASERKDVREREREWKREIGEWEQKSSLLSFQCTQHSILRSTYCANKGK